MDTLKALNSELFITLGQFVSLFTLILYDKYFQKLREPSFSIFNKK